MRLAMYSRNSAPRLGVIHDDVIFDANHARHAYAEAGGEGPGARLVDALVPPDALAFLEAGDVALREAANAVSWCREIVEANGAVHGRWGELVAHPLGEVRLHPPVTPAKFIGIGLNYRDHAEEQGARIPKNPMIFAKFASSLVGPYDDIRYPGVTDELDYEAELAVVIGRTAKDVPVEDALAFVAGYTCCNDVTARDVQLADRQWLRGKTPDLITPLGPTLVTSDEVGDPGALAVELQVNGETLQSSSTSQLIFGVPELVSFLSHAFTLVPGDVIATGTPGGVGFARDPKRFLEVGDVVRVEVERVGIIENRVVAA